jgi:hypothetical protein
MVVYIKVILALIPLLMKIVDLIKEHTKGDPVKFLTDLDEAIEDMKSETKNPKKLQDLLKSL